MRKVHRIARPPKKILQLAPESNYYEAGRPFCDDCPRRDAAKSKKAVLGANSMLPSS
jgi:hypothetical protein